MLHSQHFEKNSKEFVNKMHLFLFQNILPESPRLAMARMGFLGKSAGQSII